MPDRVEQQIRAKGLKFTRQRLLIAQVIFDANGSLDFPELFRRVRERDRHISRATVYRTLRLLMRAGIVDSYILRDGRHRFERAGDGHHDGLIDLGTGEVADFADARLELLLEKVAQQLGYRLVDHQLEIYAFRATRNCPDEVSLQPSSLKACG